MSNGLIDLVTRGVLLAKNAARKMRTVQVQLFADDLRDDVEHFEPYGFTSEAKTGAEVLAASLAGDRAHDRFLHHRPTLPPHGTQGWRGMRFR